jgi:drug/metabolite transporter (DMT)-like permease
VGAALGAATTYSAYLVGTDRVLRLTSPLTSAMWVSAGASLGLIAFAALTGNGTLPSGWSEWWPVIGMGLATAAAFACLLAGIRRVGAAALAVVFLGESVTGGIALGGALILVGAVVASLARPTTVQEQQVP